MIRQFLLRPDMTVTTSRGEIPCISREALQAAFLDCASVVHTHGGHWTQVSTRARTDVPNESVTTQVIFRWVDHTETDRPQAEAAAPAPAPPPTPVEQAAAPAPPAAPAPDVAAPLVAAMQAAATAPPPPPPPAPSAQVGIGASALPFHGDQVVELPPGQDPAYVAGVPLPDAAAGDAELEEDDTSWAEATR